MPYEINITPVGENEYPLIRVLHRTIFEPFAPQDRPDVESALRESAILLLGHLEGNPLGFMAASPEAACVRIVSCGVMKEYRRLGVGGRMLEWVLTQADARKLAIEAVVHAAHEPMSQLLRQRGFLGEPLASGIHFVRPCS